jgi:DNA modification methylase/DNA-directed RNA polymerase specialized sigma24 family protein
MPTEGRPEHDEWTAAVRQAQAGDFGPLDRIARPQLRSVARRLSPRWAEECVQAGLLKIWRRIGTVDLERGPTVRHYLMTIGTRAMRDEMRRAIAVRETPVDDLEVADDRPDEELGLHGRLTNRCIEALRKHRSASPALRAVARKAKLSVRELERRVRSEITSIAPLLDIDLPEYLEDEEVIAAMRDGTVTVPRMAKPTIRTERVDISKLTADPGNVRLHDKANLEAIASSLRRFGQQKPIVVGQDGTVVAGNGTLEAARTIGWTHIDIVRTTLAGAEAKAFAVADNRTAELAEWDSEALAELLKDLEREDASLLEAAGFDEEALARLMGIDPKEGLTDPDAVPPLPATATARPGDLWILGEHRLLCGDSADTAAVDRLLDGEKVRLVNTDPPYNVAARTRSRPQGRAKDRTIANDDHDEAEYARLVGLWFAAIARALEPGCAFYVYGCTGNFMSYPEAMRTAGLHLSQSIVWVKGHPVMGRRDFMGNHELCFYGWREGAPHRWFGPRNLPDVWEVAAPVVRRNEAALLIEVPVDHEAVTDVWRIRKVTPQKMVHLTEKPTALAIKAMGLSTLEGEAVLDLFGGSGSTMIAAEQAGRRARLMELDRPYCDVIVQRWEQFTGRKAELQRR